MIVYVECERCRGEGWLLTREPRLGPGLYETTCPKCDGHGAYTTAAEDELEDCVPRSGQRRVKRWCKKVESDD